MSMEMVTWSGHNLLNTLYKTFEEWKNLIIRIRHSNKIKSSPLPIPKFRISIKLRKLFKLGLTTRLKRLFMQKKSVSTSF